MKKSKIPKIIKKTVRNDMIEDGAYDGRYNTKVIPNKKEKINKHKKSILKDLDNV